MENHSFDDLYGMFPGADGIANAAARPRQADLSGNVCLNLPFAASFTPATSPIPNAPYLVETAVANAYAPGVKIPDLVHRFYQEQAHLVPGIVTKNIGDLLNRDPLRGASVQSVATAPQTARPTI